MLAVNMPRGAWAVNAYAANARPRLLRELVAQAQSCAVQASLAAPRVAGLRLPALRPCVLSVRRSGAALSCSVILTSEATSVATQALRWHAFEDRRRKKLANRRVKWEARRVEMAARGDVKRADYAAKRARALSRDVAPTLDECGRRQRPQACHCTGAHAGAHSVRFMCRQFMLCDECNRRRASKLKRRMAAGLDAALTSAMTDYRRRGCPRRGRPQIVLMTMTVRHSGDVEADRDAIERGWRRFYKRLHKRGLDAPYCGAWEATSGRDGLGHVHLHVAIVWPFVEWKGPKGLRALWLASCPESNHIDLAARRRDGLASTGKSAASYIAKYLSKGVSVDRMGVDLSADVVASAYNRRSVKSSARFWVPLVRRRCGTCAAVPWMVSALGDGGGGRTFVQRVAHHVEGRVPVERHVPLPLTHHERWRGLLADRYTAPVASWLAGVVGERRAFELAELCAYADAVAAAPLADGAGRAPVRIPRDVVRAWSDVANADALAATFEAQTDITGLC